MRSGHLSSYLLLGCVIFSAIVGCSDPFPEVEDAVDEYWLASFAAFDTDDGGTISLAEWTRTEVLADPDNQSQALAADMTVKEYAVAEFLRLDLDRSGGIDLKEFTAQREPLF